VRKHDATLVWATRIRLADRYRARPAPVRYALIAAN
jgi:hypothetical protein